MRGRLVCGGGCVMWQWAMWSARVVVDIGDVGVRVVVVFRCQAVCGRPGIFVVVGVASG